MKRMSIVKWDKRNTAVCLDHYLICAYDYEEGKAKVLVVDPDIEEPTLMLKPHASRATSSNILALVVPSRIGIKLEDLQTLTRVVASYFQYLPWTEQERREGRKFDRKERPITLT